MTKKNRDIFVGHPVDIVAIVLDLNYAYFFQFKVSFVLKMLLFLVWTIVHHCILIIEKRDILVLGAVPAQGLDDATKAAEAKYSVDFTISKIIFVSLHYHGSNRFLFLNSIKIYQFKAEDLEKNMFFLSEKYFKRFCSQ